MRKYFLAILVLATGCNFNFHSGKSAVQKPPNPGPQMHNLSGVPDGTPLLIYTTFHPVAVDKNTGQTTDQALDIFLKVGQNNPTQVAELHNAGYLVLSPKRDLLAFSANGEIHTLDLDSGQLSPALGKGSTAGFSPDQTKLFISEPLDPQGQNVRYHIYDLAHSTDQILAPHVLAPETKIAIPVSIHWRPDDKVVFYFGGLSGISTYYDLANNNYGRVPPQFNPGFVFSPDNTIMAANTGADPDPCDTIDPGVFSVYKLVDSASEAVKWTIGQPDKMTFVLAIAPDDNQVLYYEQDPPKPADCNASKPNSTPEPKEQYYITDSGGNTKPVGDPLAIAEQWGYQGFLESDCGLGANMNIQCTSLSFAGHQLAHFDPPVALFDQNFLFSK